MVHVHVNLMKRYDSCFHHCYLSSSTLLLTFFFVSIIIIIIIEQILYERFSTTNNDMSVSVVGKQGRLILEMMS